MNLRTKLIDPEFENMPSEYSAAIAAYQFSNTPLGQPPLYSDFNTKLASIEVLAIDYDQGNVIVKTSESTGPKVVPLREFKPYIQISFDHILEPEHEYFLITPKNDGEK